MSAFRINTNVSALFAQRNLFQTNGKLDKNIERLSTGLRINRAADDAAGLAISDRLTSQTQGLEQAGRNIQDSISLIQTAEGGISTVSGILQRVRTLSVQAANDTLTTVDRALIQVEVNQLLDEVDRFSTSVQFNTLKLIDGTFGANGSVFSQALGATPVGRSLTMQVGANTGETISFQLGTLTTGGLGLSKKAAAFGTLNANANATLSGNDLRVKLNSSLTAGNVLAVGATATDGLLNRSSAASAITVLDQALNKLDVTRAKLGAIQNRLQRTAEFAGVQRENMAASNSRIKDLDFSNEIIKFTKNQILRQSGTAALAQANVQSQSVLQLLR